MTMMLRKTCLLPALSAPCLPQVQSPNRTSHLIIDVIITIMTGMTTILTIMVIMVAMIMPIVMMTNLIDH